jgi:alkanesulfonate monooxygenase SsuD/methylene tetrahydromethanopterin reductase-like flavin-dependent oxidoreductase (luciferase family)
MMGILRELWSGEPTEHHGEFYDFPALTMRPAPTGEIPILLAGSTPMALRRTARLADGWIGHGNTPDEAEAVLDEIQRLRIEAERSHLPFECIVPIVGDPKADDFERLATKGMNAGVAFPPSLSIGIKNPSLQQELDYIEGFAESMIRPFKGVGE